MPNIEPEPACMLNLQELSSTACAVTMANRPDDSSPIAMSIAMKEGLNEPSIQSLAAACWKPASTVPPHQPSPAVYDPFCCRADSLRLSCQPSLFIVDLEWPRRQHIAVTGRSLHGCLVLYLPGDADPVLGTCQRACKDWCVRVRVNLRVG